MIIYYAYFKFPGIENARKKLENAKKDPGNLQTMPLIKY